jgi:hypothetical protein
MAPSPPTPPKKQRHALHNRRATPVPVQSDTHGTFIGGDAITGHATRRWTLDTHCLGGRACTLAILRAWHALLELTSDQRLLD